MAGVVDPKNFNPRNKKHALRLNATLFDYQQMVDAKALGQLFLVKSIRAAALLTPNLPTDYIKLRDILDQQLPTDKLNWLSLLEPWVEFKREEGEDDLVARYNKYVEDGVLNPNRRADESK